MAVISTRPYFMDTLFRVVIDADRTGGTVMDELADDEMMQFSGVEMVQYCPRSRYVVFWIPYWRFVAADVREGTILSAPSAMKELAESSEYQTKSLPVPPPMEDSVCQKVLLRVPLAKSSSMMGQ